MKLRIFLLIGRWSALAMTVAIGLGCGGGGGVKKITVTGNVTYDGKPVDGGIEFYSQEATLKGGSNTTGSVQNGKFSVSGVSPGKNKVVVTSSGGGSGGPARPATYDDMKNMKQPDMRDPMKVKADFAKKGAAAPDAIPREAPGNGQVFDITDNMAPLDIKILKK